MNTLRSALPIIFYTILYVKYINSLRIRVITRMDKLKSILEKIQEDDEFTKEYF